MTLTPHTAQWMRVGAFFQNGSGACVDCPHYKQLHQSHPYGEGTASEDLSECTLGQLASHRPWMCPALQAEDEDREPIKGTGYDFDEACYRGDALMDAARDER